MNQRSSVPLKTRFAQLIEADIPKEGTSTTISKNSEVVQAVWREVGAVRVQTMLAPEDWGKLTYDVEFLPSVVDAPYSLKAGDQISGQGMNAVVRHVEPKFTAGVVFAIRALCVVLPGN